MSRGIHITSAQAAEALEAWESNNHSRKNAAAALGISTSAFQRRLTAAQRGTGAVATDENQTIRALRDKVGRLQAQLQEIQRDNISAEEVRKHIFKLSDTNIEPPKWLAPKIVRKSGVTGVPQALWSDWHLGERVELSETN